MTIHDYFSSILDSLLLPLIFWGILFLSMHKDRSRYRNCALLMLAGINTLPLIIAIAGPWGRWASVLIFLLILFFILLVPFFLVFNGITMIRKEGHSLANLLSLALGLIVGIGELSFLAAVLIPNIALFGDDSFQSLLNRHIPWLLLFVGFSVIYLSLSFVSFMFYTLFLEAIPRKRDFDYVIIHGAGLIHGDRISRLLADRIDKAIEVYRKDPTPPILIPSGGKGSDESISEAEAMASYLREKGIPEDHILVENQSMTTFENLQFSKALIETRPGNHYTALVTSNYHVYRALRYCRKIGLKCTGIGSHVAFYYWPSALIREYIAIHSEKKHLIFFLAGWFVLICFPMLTVLFFMA